MRRCKPDEAGESPLSWKPREPPTPHIRRRLSRHGRRHQHVGADLGVQWATTESSEAAYHPTVTSGEHNPDQTKPTTRRLHRLLTQRGATSTPRSDATRARTVEYIGGPA